LNSPYLNNGEDTKINILKLSPINRTEKNLKKALILLNVYLSKNSGGSEHFKALKM